jgi:hypothetical protein
MQRDLGIQQTLDNPITVNLNQNMKTENAVHSRVYDLKDTWDLAARGLSDCVEGSWRD